MFLLLNPSPIGPLDGRFLVTKIVHGLNICASSYKVTIRCHLADLEVLLIKGSQLLHPKLSSSQMSCFLKQ